MIERTVVRLIVLEPGGRVLLIRYPRDGRGVPFWVPRAAAEGITDAAWFSAEDLVLLDETVYPEDLAGHLRRLVSSEAPNEPIDITP